MRHNSPIMQLVPSAGYTVITPTLLDSPHKWIEEGPHANNPDNTGALLDQLPIANGS